MSIEVDRNQAVVDYETIAGPPQGLSEAEKVVAAVVSLSANIITLNNTLCGIWTTIEQNGEGYRG